MQGQTVWLHGCLLLFISVRSTNCLSQFRTPVVTDIAELPKTDAGTIRDTLQRHLALRREAQGKLGQAKRTLERHKQELSETVAHQSKTPARFHKQYIDVAQQKVLAHLADTEEARKKLVAQSQKLNAAHEKSLQEVQELQGQDGGLSQEISEARGEKANLDNLIKLESAIANGVDDVHDKHMGDLNAQVTYGSAGHRALEAELAAAKREEAALQARIAGVAMDHESRLQHYENEEKMKPINDELARVQKELEQVKGQLAAEPPLTGAAAAAQAAYRAQFSGQVKVPMNFQVPAQSAPEKPAAFEDALPQLIAFQQLRATPMTTWLAEKIGLRGP